MPLTTAYINDYGTDAKTLAKCAAKEYPRHHLWGLHRWFESGRPILRVPNRHTSPFRNPSLRRIHSMLLWGLSQLQLVWATRNADVVYCAQVGFKIGPAALSACLNGLKLTNKRIVIVLQNPGVYIPFPKAHHRIIFISQEVMEEFASLPRNRGITNIEHLFWGPDLEFYDHQLSSLPQPPAPTPDNLHFISNGKTARDNPLFLRASQILGTHATVVCDNSFQPTPEQRGNPRFRIVTHNSAGNVISDVDNVRLLREAHVMVLPIQPDRQGLFGTTSFLDAISLGMPIIEADNTRIGVDVESEGFGFFYKAGDLDSLQDKMSRFQQNPGLVQEMGAKARRFAEANRMERFQQRIESLLS